MNLYSLFVLEEYDNYQKMFTEWENMFPSKYIQITLMNFGNTISRYWWIQKVQPVDYFLANPWGYRTQIHREVQICMYITLKKLNFEKHRKSCNSTDANFWTKIMKFSSCSIINFRVCNSMLIKPKIVSKWFHENRLMTLFGAEKGPLLCKTRFGP